MNYIVSDKHTLVWLFFIIYSLTALLIFSTQVKFLNQISENENQQLDFAFRLVLRTALVLPLIIFLKVTI